MTRLITILLPFFNEEGWIGATIDSLARQSDRRFHLLLLDNGSTDGGRAEALRHLASLPVDATAGIMEAPVPGKVNALAAGLAQVHTPFVAICDADTLYPPDYIGHCLSLFAAHPDAAAIMAIDLYDPVGTRAAHRRIRRVLDKARMFADRCHAGGYAQSFRTDILRRAGGFDLTRWPFVLEDHEIVHRIHRLGRSVYDPNHYCHPSPRRANRCGVTWTRLERLLYRFAPRRLMDWFFYDFLWRRLERRNAFSVALREKNWI